MSNYREYLKDVGLLAKLWTFHIKGSIENRIFKITVLRPYGQSTHALTNLQHVKVTPGQTDYLLKTQFRDPKRAIKERVPKNRSSAHAQLISAR